LRDELRRKLAPVVQSDEAPPRKKHANKRKPEWQGLPLGRKRRA